MLWIYALAHLERFSYSYMVTLAGLLLVYSITAFLGGSGPVSVLLFGLVIGNRASLLRLLRRPNVEILTGEKVHSFHNEITFFVRSFFFIFLGMTFNTAVGGEWTVHSLLPLLSAIDRTAALFLLGVGLMFLAIVASRYLVVRFISARGNPTRMTLVSVYGRGLGTAVLATFPFTVSAYDPAATVPTAYTELMRPWEAIFLNTALLIILLTVLGTTIAIWKQERRLAQAGERKPATSRRSS
jgi:cell volume regulation protein A